MSSHHVALGFDFGLKRIGVAVGQSITGSATALDTLTTVNNQPDWDKIQQLIETWKPTQIIVGDPLTMEGEPTHATQAARDFAKNISARFHYPVAMQDERMSSREASAIIKQQRKSGERKRRTRKGDLDELAAALIVQRWLQENT